MSSTLGHNSTLYGSSTNRARLAGPPVNAVKLLKLAGNPFGIDVIGNRRAA